MSSLVQLLHPGHGRAVALVDGGDTLRLLSASRSAYELVQQALAAGRPLIEMAREQATGPSIPYDEAYSGNEWRILTAFDHPAEPGRCHVTGTGLTHRASADNRNAMHQAQAQETDSMRMYRWGVEGGRPEPGTVGTSPEWFYKGNGTILLGHGATLEVPDFADDGGEEAEIAGVYVIDGDGLPRRVGMTQGNEFSDHVFEKKNYLYLASSKLRQCAIGPELVIDPDFQAVTGRVRILDGDTVRWEKDIRSGEANMCHSLENMEHHHFKFPLHRREGDVHVHFFGAGAFSFGEGVRLADGDVMEVAYHGFGRPLRNPVHVVEGEEALVKVRPV
jgi:hypothetical protein